MGNWPAYDTDLNLCSYPLSISKEDSEPARRHGRDLEGVNQIQQRQHRLAQPPLLRLLLLRLRGPFGPLRARCRRRSLAPLLVRRRQAQLWEDVVLVLR